MRMPLNYEEKAVRLPNPNLTSPTMKNALLANLVKPLVEHRIKVLALRVIWKRPGLDTESTWRYIVDHRRHCDAVMSGVSKAVLYVSSIAGMYSRSGKKEITEHDIFPAVGYWIVSTDESFQLSDVLVPMTQALAHTANVRPITDKVQHSEQGIANALYIVMKDHGGHYVKNKIKESIQAMGVEQIEQPARIVLKEGCPNIIVSVIQNTRVALTSNKVCLDIYGLDGYL